MGVWDTDGRNCSTNTHSCWDCSSENKTRRQCIYKLNSWAIFIIIWNLIKCWLENRNVLVAEGIMGYEGDGFTIHRWSLEAVALKKKIPGKTRVKILKSWAIFIIIWKKIWHDFRNVRVAKKTMGMKVRVIRFIGWLFETFPKQTGRAKDLLFKIKIDIWNDLWKHCLSSNKTVLQAIHYK